MAKEGRTTMRTIFLTEDILQLVKTAYGKLNTEPIVIVDSDTGEQTETDTVKYLNLQFYSWKDRLVDSRDIFDGQTSVFENWVDSLNSSMNEAYGLVEITSEENVASQSIDSGVIRAKITFLIQADKIKVLDRVASKIKNSYLGSPQEIQNGYGETVTAFLQFGALTYDQEPTMTPLGETIVCSQNFVFTYLKGASTSESVQVALHLGELGSGETITDTVYENVILIKTTWQNIVSSSALPRANAPERTGFIGTGISTALTISFYDFNDDFGRAFNHCFWAIGATKTTGVANEQVNIPVYVRVVQNGITYYYTTIIDKMEKVITNGDFTINSLTLKGSAIA